VVHQVAVLAMDGNKEAGTREVEHHLVLLAAGVTRNMDFGPFVVVYFGAGAVEVVDGAVDQFFVARDGCGRDHDVIARADVHLAMLAHCHAHQR